MARARNIKPGLFKNEVLGVADPLYTLLFEGLWVLADRAGRLEDRPLRIKGEVFPYRDGIDMESMLNWLQGEGFIARYAVDGKRFIQILNFSKHQNPHKNEAPSEIPECSGACTEKIGTEPDKVGSTRADSLYSDSLYSDSLNLIPDPPNLIPDSVPNGTGAVGAEKPQKVTDPDEIIFGYGVPLLVNAGSQEKHARSFLGKLRKTHGDEAVINKLRDCIREKPIQPLEWLAAALPPARASPQQSRDESTKAAARLLGFELEDVIDG